MFKKIINSMFALILVIFSAMTVVSCATTDLSAGLQRLFYKNAQIASFAATAAILNDKEDALATSSNSALEGGTINQKYLMNKYGQITVDSALGKDFIINQTSSTKMHELFESTFENGFDYIYTNENASGNKVISDAKSGYTTGTTALDSITTQIEPILDMLTIGISPSTLSTIVGLFFQEKITVPGLSFSGVMKYIETNSKEIDKVMNNYILDYNYQSEESLSIKESMDKLAAEIKKQPSETFLSIQFIKMTLKSAYNFFDEYLKGRESDYQSYTTKTLWTSKDNNANMLADNVIDFSKLTNLFKYATTTDATLISKREAAHEALTPMKPYINNVIGNIIQSILKKVGIMPNWKVGGGASLVNNVFDLIDQLFKYLSTKDEKEFNKLVDTNIKKIINEIGDVFIGMDKDFYLKNLKDPIVNLIESANIPIVGGILVSAAKDSPSALGKQLKGLTGFLTWWKVSSEVKKLLKPILDKIDINSFPSLSDIFGFKPILLMDEKGFLSELGTGSENTLKVLLGAFKNLSIENIAKFFADRLEPMSKDKNITFNLNYINQFIDRVKNTQVIIDNNFDKPMSLSEFTYCEDPYGDQCKFEWSESVKIVNIDTEESYEYVKGNAPVNNQQFYMSLGLDQMGANVAKGSIGETIVKLLGKDSGELLYSVSNIIQDILINIPNQSKNDLDKKFMKPLYERSNWTMDEFTKFRRMLPPNVDKKNPEFSFNLYRKLPNSNIKKTYVVTIKQADNKYWEITNITK